jgi:ABC-type transport system substrate-binding protein
MKLSFLAILLAGVGAAGLATSPKSLADTLRFGLAADQAPLNPHARQIDATSRVILSHIYEPLLAYAPGGSIYPLLATEWEVDDSGHRWVFHLRPDVKFHDGTPFDAYSVQAFFHRIFGAPDFPSAALASTISNITEVRVLDDLSVEITTSSPDALLPDALTRLPISFSSNFEEFIPEPADVHGTGPYLFSRHERDALVQLERNPSYWGDIVPEWQAVTFYFIPDELARIASLQAQEVDIIIVQTPRAASRASQAQDISLIEGPPSTLVYLSPNAANPGIFEDADLIHALSAAIDREQLAREAFRPWFCPAFGLIPPGFLGFIEHEELLLPDPSQWLAEMDELGMTNIELPIEYLLQSIHPDLLDALEQQLRAIGIRAQLRPVQPADYYSVFRMSEAPLHLARLRVSHDSTIALSRVVGSDGDFERRALIYRDGSVSEIPILVDNLRFGFDWEERPANLRALAEEVVEKGLIIPLIFQGDYVWAMQCASGHCRCPGGGCSEECCSGLILQ